MMLRVISLGAGVQSTTMALMAAHGEIGPMPDCAIFADTGDEPADVYRHLAWLMSPNVLPFPVHVVSQGRLSDRLREGDDTARVPFYVGAGGISKRQCTRNFKIRPIRKTVRDILGRPGRAYIAPGAVEQWIGISTDESIRMKPSGVAFTLNRHPLIEKFMSRADCKVWLTAHEYPIPPKSACVFCPYQANEQWRKRYAQPDEWREILRMDDWLAAPEQVARFHGRLFVHRSRVPMAEADLRAKEMPLFGTEFAEECEGMCGV